MFDFDEVIDRRKTDSIKWKVEENELPMWVADMDFKTAPCIINDIKKRADEGIFGYSDIEDEWYEAYINWYKSKYNFSIEREDLLFSTGIIPSLSTIVRRLTLAAENVVVQTPVYNMFFNSIVNNGRRILENPLIYKDYLPG